MTIIDSSVVSLPQNDILKKAAFTLAEVLITLGIIGVVAALTLPNLMTAYNNHITETRLKKFYSTFNQAIRLSTIDNGEPEGWTDYWEAPAGTEDPEPLKKAVEKYLLPYMKISHIKQSSIGGVLYVFPDGSAFHFASGTKNDIGFYPKNPEKCFPKPNSEIYGICGFAFNFNPNSTNWGWKYLENQGLEPYMYGWDGKIESLYTGKTWSCDGNNATYCTAIIKQNGWKIPKDYPKKIRY